MKKIDLHMHTVRTVWDHSDFEFDLATLKRYVEHAHLDAISVTNHNTFDRSQFDDIVSALSIAVFPGIEVSVAGAHILVIADNAHIDTFAAQTEVVARELTTKTDRMSLERFREVFTTLGDYLVIPHYHKSPAISPEALAALSEFIWCGEVSSVKKFLRTLKDNKSLTPVVFSDARLAGTMTVLPTQQTYLDCGELTFSAMRGALRDRRKIALSRDAGNKLFQVFDNGQKLSTGLNVIIGERSSGKTYTLERLRHLPGEAKYIEQFELVQDEDEFEEQLERDQGGYIEDYLANFRTVVGDVIAVDLRHDERLVDEYVTSLHELATAHEAQDEFSKATLFNTSQFSLKKDQSLVTLFDAVRHLIENTQYRDVITRHVSLESLRALAVELIDLNRTHMRERSIKKSVNEIVRDVKEELSMRSSGVQLPELDLYTIALNKKKAARFAEIVRALQCDEIIHEENIRSFRIVARKGRFRNASQIGEAIRRHVSFKDAFKEYDDPYGYLRYLVENVEMDNSDLYKVFARVTHETLNKHGKPVSGGERSELRLVQTLRDAQDHDILLIDEPESSFSNQFLHTDVNSLLKEIAKSMPVVIVTHNSSVGASIGADYLLYAEKTVENGKDVYRLFSGSPSDRYLVSPDGRKVSTYTVTLGSLEAGPEPHKQRGDHYADLKN